MPNYITAKGLSERSLRYIGAFPPSQSQADAGELSVAMQWLEMLLNLHGAKRVLAGTFKVVDIPLQADVGDYLLSDFTETKEAMHVFSVGLVDEQDNYTPLTMLYGSQAATENLSKTGTPDRVHITKDVKPALRVFPEPKIEDEAAGRVLRVRFQTYASAIDPRGIGDNNLSLRPGWYLWAVNALAYEIGKGPVRRLNEYELKRFQDDALSMLNGVLAKDGLADTGQPQATEPWDM